MLNLRPFFRPASWCAAAGLALVALAGCDHATDPDGPDLTDRFGDFNVLDALSVNRDSVDFAAGEAAVFTARFNKQTDWVLEIVGDSSGAVKRIEGFANELMEENARWVGRTTELPLFKAEPVTARLFFPDEEGTDTTTVSLAVATPRVYPGIVAADFEQGEDGFTEDIFLGNFEFEFDLTATGRSSEIPAGEGDQFYLFRSTGAPPVADPFFIGLIDITPGGGEPIFEVPTTVPDDLYLNFFLYGFGTPNALAVPQVIVDANGTGNYEIDQDAAIPYGETPIDFTGWRLFSKPLSELGLTDEQAGQIVAIRMVVINEQPESGDPIEYGLDYITFTAGGPLEP
jgi:hypothetical protein